MLLAKRSIFFVLLILLWQTYTISAQTIEGQLYDTEGEPVPYANVLLLCGADSTFVTGSTSNEFGAFSITGEITPPAIVRVMALGFQEKTISVEPDVQHLRLVLEAVGMALDQVTVTGRKMLFELKPDRLVMNVAATPSLSGNTALQVLQKTPGLVVNRQENSIAMAARGEVLLMINDRVQRVPSAVIMARLEAMPAENIETIEIIHQPPARYDASGAAGIVHIILKRGGGEGTSGNYTVTAGYGRGPKAIGNVSVNHRKSDINLYGDYSYSLDHHSGITVDHYREYEYEGNNFYYQNLVEFENRRLRGHSLNLGMDVSLPGGTLLGVRLSGAMSEDRIPTASSRSAGSVNGDLQSNLDYTMRTLAQTRNGFANISLQQKVGNKGTLTAEGDFAAIYFSNHGELQPQFGDTDHNIITDRSTPVSIWMAKADYEQGLGAKARLDFGLKGTVGTSNSSTSALNPVDEEWGIGEFINVDHQVNEQILAAYASISGPIIAGLTGEAGVRLEDYRFDLISSGVEDRENVWTNLFPILRMNYAIDSISNLQLSFNRGINRPPFAFQTGYLFLVDPTLFISSNPTLQPAFTSTVRLAAQRRSTIISLTYLRSINELFWQNTVEKEQGAQLSFPDNLDRSSMLVLELSSAVSLATGWDISGTLNASRKTVEDEVGRKLRYRDDIVTYFVQISQTLDFGRGWKFNIDGRYMSDYLQGDQIQYTYPFINLGLRKQFANGSSLTLAIQDPTNSMARRDWAYRQPALSMATYGNNNFSEPQVRVSFATTFGKSNVRSKRERETAGEIRERL